MIFLGAIPISATVEGAIAEKYKVQGYPTLLWAAFSSQQFHVASWLSHNIFVRNLYFDAASFFKKGGTDATPYEGPRKLDPLVGHTNAASGTFRKADGTFNHTFGIEA